MIPRTFLRAVVALAFLEMDSAHAGAARAQDYDDDGNRILTRAEVLAAIDKFERMQAAMRRYATVGVDAEALVDAPNAFDLVRGHRPDVVTMMKNSDPSDPARSQTFMLRIRDTEGFQSVEEWRVTDVKGNDGKTRKIAKLDLEASTFNDGSYALFFQQDIRGLEAAYKAGRLPPVTEVEPFMAVSGYYINDLTKVDPSRATVAFVVAKGVTVDAAGPVKRSFVASYYRHTCTDPVVTSGSAAPSSEFAAKARDYTFSCKDGLVQGAPDGSLRIWFPGDEKPAPLIRP